MTYLDFEKPIEELNNQLKGLKKIDAEGKVDMTSAIKELDDKLLETKKQLYGNLNAWQRVQLSRHPERPYTLFYLQHICSNFLELHGDRNIADDHAMVGGFGDIDGHILTDTFIGLIKTNSNALMYGSTLSIVWLFIKVKTSTKM